MVQNSDTETKKNGRRLQKLLLAENEWELIKKLIEILRQFDTVTTTLSGRDFVTLSLVAPLIFFLKKKFLELIEMNYEENDENNKDVWPDVRAIRWRSNWCSLDDWFTDASA